MSFKYFREDNDELVEHERDEKELYNHTKIADDNTVYALLGFLKGLDESDDSYNVKCFKRYVSDGPMITSGGSKWPMQSWAAGCTPQQVPAMMAEAKRLGVPTEFTKDGRAIFTSRAHRKRYCEAKGFYDRNAGYGDPVPRNRR